MWKASLMKKAAVAALCLTMGFMSAIGTVAYTMTAPEAASVKTVTADITAASDAQAFYCRATRRNVGSYKGKTSCRTSYK